MPAPKGHAPYPGCETGGVKKKYTEEFIENEAILLSAWMQKPANIFIEDFCWERGYTDQRINEWIKENEKMAATYEMFKMKQKSALCKGSLFKKFGHNMCALLLSHSHGIVAKTEQKITSHNNDPLDFAYNTINGTSKDLVNESK